MDKPLVSFISFNRHGVVASNLKALLDITTDDFDLCIVDNGSTDGVWEYIENLKDERIKYKKHFDKNFGGVYAVNYSLSKREKYQPFISVENDFLIKDPNWIKKLLNTTSNFNDLGLVGAVSEDYYEQHLKSFTKFTHNDSSCIYTDFVIGGCLYTTPALLDIIGYRNEECYGADMELSRRINYFTDYKTGVTLDFFNVYRGWIWCSECIAHSTCPFTKTINGCGECCTTNYMKFYPNSSFIPLAIKQTDEYINKISTGKTTLYSPSIHDEESLKKYPYDYAAAQKNFDFFSGFLNK